MKFSVVVPVYNAQEYLGECIESVLKQTYPDYEMILIENGSVDGSAAICDGYQKNYPDRIRVMHTGNLGALMARATGVQYASGDIILFLDADDLFRYDAFQILCDAFESSGCDLVIFNGSVKENFDTSFRTYPFKDGTVFEDLEKQQVYRTLVETDILNNVCLKAAKTTVFDFDLNYSDMSHVRHGEDLVMSAQMLTAAKKILFLDQNLYFYRQNMDSVVHSTQRYRAVSIKTVHLFLEKLMPQWGFPELTALHHAREVRGWIETLHLLAREMTCKELKKATEQMAEDPYFRSAYEQSDKDQLSLRCSVKAKLLYRQQHRLFCLLNYLHI